MNTFSSDLSVAKEEIIEVVRNLHNNSDKPNVEKRKQEVNEVIEAYFSATGEMPTDKTLNRLADYLLVEELSDQYKHHKGNYIMSEKQMRRKAQRGVSFDENYGTHNKR